MKVLLASQCHLRGTQHTFVYMQALRGAMKDHTLAVDPTLTIEYQKLFTAASKCREV